MSLEHYLVLESTEQATLQWGIRRGIRQRILDTRIHSPDRVSPVYI
jgi:hypothetical protein